MSHTWLDLARRVQAIAQTGLHYTDGPYDRERYRELEGIASEMLASGSDLPAEGARALFAGERGYATPKVDVRGAVFRGEEILLVREREDGLWTLPGGWADVGDAPSEAVVREIREETGYLTRAARLLAVWDRDRHDHPPLPWAVYKLVIQCDLLGGAAADSIETEGADFFPEHRIPPLSLGRVNAAQIARVFALHRDPSHPTEFD